MADVLGGYFESLASIDKYEPDFKRRIQPSRMSIRNLVIPTDVRNLQINEAFSFSELLHSLSCSNGRSAGPDGIGYPLLKYLPASGKSKLLELFNKIWTEDYYPHEWKESIVIPIPKPNSTGREPANFRPISLTCCMAKVFERMVNRRLRQHLEIGQHLDNRQHAFRAGFGTNTYFATLGETSRKPKMKECTPRSSRWT